MLNRSSGLFAVFQERKIADDDFSAMRGIFRGKVASARTEKTIQRMESELIRKPAPLHFDGGAGAGVHPRPFLESELGHVIEVVPLLFRQGLLSLFDGSNELRGESTLLILGRLFLAELRWKGLDGFVDIRNGCRYPRDIEELDRVSLGCR